MEKFKTINKNAEAEITEKKSRFIAHVFYIETIEEAIITSGGISTKEINPKTMESKIVQGLYFAGEIIDVDALTGGFNLQIAWSTRIHRWTLNSNEK